MYYPPGTDADAAKLSSDACRTQYLSMIDLFWAEFTAPTEEDLARARRDMAMCLSQAGVEIDLDAGPDEFAALLGQGILAFAQCSETVSSEHGLPGFAGG
jgi:hypothetical protein